MKYIIYCRKSSESEDHQVMSLDAQEKELIKIAESSGLQIIKTFRESMSAKAPGRPLFAQMINLLSSGKADGIICWKLDRLARNPIDGGSISWLHQTSRIKHIKTADRDYLSSDNVLMMSVEFGMSNQYVRDLSENVKRGNREKMRRGEWPNHAPYGYVNDRATKTVVVDPAKAHWIQRMFELYASGTRSLKNIACILYEEGLRTGRGTKVYHSVVERVVKNPFYYGVMSREGVHYQGNHKPIISKELFDNAQGILNQNSRPRPKIHFFPLRGSMRCRKCDCMLTASLKKGHRYYYCTNGKGVCEQGKSYMREEYLSEKLAVMFDQLHFDEELIDLMYEAAKEKIGFNADRIGKALKNLNDELNLVSERESRLTDGFASGSVRNDLYDTKMAELNNQRVELERQLSELKTKSGSEISTLDRSKNVFLEANRAKNEFVNARDEKKQSILNTLLWNVWFQDKEIKEIQYKTPYSIIARVPKDADFQTLLAGQESNLESFGSEPNVLPITLPANFRIIAEILNFGNFWLG